VVALYLVLLAFDVWLVFVVADGPWQDKVSLVLAIVGIFGLAVGLLNRSEFKKALADFIDIDDMTSHNLRFFIAGTLRPLGASAGFMISFVFGRGPLSRRDIAIGWRIALFPLSVVGFFAAGAVYVLWFVAAAAYLVIVAPFSYLAYALVSLPLLRIRDSSEGADRHLAELGDLRPPEIVRDNFAELRIFMVGVIPPVFAFVIKLIQLY
jgi:hypothetical protein